MSVITNVTEPNLWEEICLTTAAKRPPFRDDDTLSVHTLYEDFNPGKHNPVFYGKMHQKVAAVDCDVNDECNPSVCHPSMAGYALIEKPLPSPEPAPAALPQHQTCSPRQYLEAYIFPLLLPAMEQMLKQAKIERCFERKRTKFNGLDFLTEYLYGRNPAHTDRDITSLGQIPFVEEHWKLHPRPPLPMSLLWTEDEASLIIQAFWRGYKIRCEPQIQELRQWQREWRQENANIQHKVSDFWAQQMPDGEDTPSVVGNSEDQQSGNAQDVSEEQNIDVVSDPQTPNPQEEIVATEPNHSESPSTAPANELDPNI